MSRCDALARCSEDEGRLTRRFLSAPMREVHNLISGWMRELRMSARVDAAGNIVGRRAGVEATQTLLLGSHLDTVPGAGRYDGVLGVILALSVVEKLGDADLPFHIDVIGFSEEEGVRYGMPYLGSHAVAGSFQRDWLERRDADGISIREAIGNFSRDADRIEDASYAPDEVIGFIEPHIEQGPMLESMDLPVGVVSGIVGQSRYRLEFCGKAGHAGTTPMLGRSDALVMASEFVQAVQVLGRQTENLRATVGCLEVVESAANVIPGRVRLSLDVRHGDDLIRERAISDLLVLGQKIAANAQGEFNVVEKTSDPAVQLDAQLSEALADSIQHHSIEATRLFSGAGHDSIVMAEKFPTAMLFLRHPGGVSHHPDERVDRDDVAAAIDVLSDCVLRLANISIPT